ncbi:MAG: hypothetical protein HQL83_12995 [Magnetococcales bacterium]|nr:hypothetical protein [Magnetococcales bacterium]MBF0348324.1 hypothetical protein [Magnetococcales bacterium]MBF0631555.1 hypothetical protein [Magnetococcales bacterium]
MKKRTLALIASIALAAGFASSVQAHDWSHDGVPHSHHAHPGEWKSGGWTQWHNMPGYTQLGSVGTQLFQVHEQKVVGYNPYAHGHHGYFGSYVHNAGMPMMAMFSSCACKHDKAANQSCACMKGACACNHDKAASQPCACMKGAGAGGMMHGDSIHGNNMNNKMK